MHFRCCDYGFGIRIKTTSKCAEKIAFSVELKYGLRIKSGGKQGARCVECHSSARTASARGESVKQHSLRTEMANGPGLNAHKDIPCGPGDPGWYPARRRWWGW